MILKKYQACERKLALMFLIVSGVKEWPTFLRVARLAVTLRGVENPPPRTFAQNLGRRKHAKSFPGKRSYFSRFGAVDAGADAISLPKYQHPID